MNDVVESEDESAQMDGENSVVGGVEDEEDRECFI